MPQQASIQYGPGETTLTGRTMGLFVQDDWKITRNLTLNLGVRWEAHIPRFDANDRINGFDPSKINPVSGTPGIVTFANRDGYSRSLYNGDYNNVMPRFGFAWKPFGLDRTVVRGGYGIFFGPPLPGSNNTSAWSMVSPDIGSRTVASMARRDSGTRPTSASSAARACGPEIRTTPIAAGTEPEESA